MNISDGDVIRYTKGAELDPIATTWPDPAGAVRNFSAGWTFTARIGDQSGMFVEKTTGFVGAATAPNLTLTWSPADLDVLPSGAFRLDLIARQTSSGTDLIRSWLFVILPGVGIPPLPGAPIFPELVAGDPAEVGLVTVGDVTTLSLLDTIARTQVHRAGFYDLNYKHALSGAQTMTQDSMRLQPVILSKGTIDRIGVEVTTAVASLIVRLGIYTDDAAQPLARIAEAATTADASTTGVKDLTITVVIPKNGRYWLASVSQGAAGGALRAPTSHCQHILFPIGTSPPSGATGYLCRTQTGVTGALPATIGTLVEPAANVAHMVHYRYATVG